MDTSAAIGVLTTELVLFGRIRIGGPGRRRHLTPCSSPVVFVDTGTTPDAVNVTAPPAGDIDEHVDDAGAAGRAARHRPRRRSVHVKPPHRRRERVLHTGAGYRARTYVAGRDRVGNRRARPVRLGAHRFRDLPGRFAARAQSAVVTTRRASPAPSTSRRCSPLSSKPIPTPRDWTSSTDF